MGRKVPASDVWSAMLANNQTIDEVAAVWNIPNQAVVEIIEYCQANQKLLAEEEAEELRLSKTWGVGICTYS